MKMHSLAVCSAVALTLASAGLARASDDPVGLSVLGRFSTGIFDESAAEIPAYDAASQRLFVSNADSGAIDVLDLSNPATPTLISSLPLPGGSPNSVAVSGGVLAVAVEQDGLGGRVDFFNAADLGLLSSSNVGALPDSLTWSPDGSRVIVANEGEPTDTADPDGSISVLDFNRTTNTATVRTADFSSFDAATLRSQGVRIFPGQTASADLEPEFVSVSPDGTRAFVTLQEANAIATVDLATATVTGITTAGVQDHSVVGLDASDRDDGINIATYDNLFGLRMPDAIASYTSGGATFYMTANEGDDRGEDERVADLTLDPTAFPNAAALQADAVLGRLGVSTIDGDIDGDGDFDQLFAYGSRSFTIYDDAGNIVFDSGDDFEQITAAAIPDFFNANNDENGPDTFESRSDNKGPEPEGIAIGEIGDKIYAFIGLERVGGVMMYDVTDPSAASFVDYLNPRDFDADVMSEMAGDLGPEGLLFISADESPIDQPLLVVTNEVSGTTTIMAIVPEPASLGLLGVAGTLLMRRRVK